MAGIESTPEYGPILGANHVVTGVRGWADNEVILTGTVAGESTTTAMIYVGELPSTDGGAIYALEPALEGRTVTGSTFYGPDTYVFNPSLGEGQIRAVGTFTCEESGPLNRGMIYQGPPSGDGGDWREIAMPADLAGGEVANTVPHSTMGDLVVGDYDLAGAPGSANAFIHNLATGTWTKLDLPGCALTTAYGIWQNGIGSGSYTIVGGTHDEAGINQGFIVDYDAETGAVAEPSLYRNPEDPVVLTHFEGITESGDGGFNLAGMAEGDVAMFAAVRRAGDGYGRALWFPFSYPGAGKTTGNTVYRNVLMGIFTVPGSEVESYAATFGPE
jgi:hypothetical protein